MYNPAGSNIAIVHDYIHTIGGAEMVVESWLKRYPTATIYVDFIDPSILTDQTPRLLKAYRNNQIKTSWEQNIFRYLSIKKWFKFFTYLHPLAMKSITIKDRDLVLISSIYSAKHARYIGNKKIICYSHSPAKFLYSGLDRESDLSNSNILVRSIDDLLRPLYRWLDQSAMQKLSRLGTEFETNSH